MAEEVIIIEKDKSSNNKFPYIIVILLLLILMLLLLLLLVVVKKKKKEEKEFNIQKIVQKLEKKNIPKDALKELIKKANLLYQQGEKEKALKILNKISEFSKTLSFYNLGVIKLQEKKYKKAIEYFQKAITKTQYLLVP
jgi:LPXTG-motif cell wall-anchored protein